MMKSKENDVQTVDGGIKVEIESMESVKPSTDTLDQQASESEIFKIVDVCSNKYLFKTFVQEFKSVNNYSFACAVNGRKDIGENTDKNDDDSLLLDNGVINGISFCMNDELTAFYLKLGSHDNEQSDADVSFQSPDTDKEISFEEKIKFLR